MRLTGNQQAPRVTTELAASRLYYAGTDLKGIAIKGNALVGDKPAGKWP